MAGPGSSVSRSDAKTLHRGHLGGAFTFLPLPQDFRLFFAYGRGASIDCADEIGRGFHNGPLGPECLTRGSSIRAGPG